MTRLVWNNVQIVKGIAKWMDVNKEAIFGTRPWKVFGEGPASETVTPLRDSGFNEGKGKPLTAADFRFTTKGEALYVIGLGWPANAQAVIHALAQATGSEHVQSVALLGGDAKLQFEQNRDGLHVRLPAQAPTKYAYALRITFGPTSH